MLISYQNLYEKHLRQAVQWIQCKSRWKKVASK